MWEITFRIKEFCSSQSTSDFLLCEMSTVLRGLFFLMINCLFGCFDRILVLSVEDRCLIRAVRGTWNFVWQQATLVQGCTSEAHLNMDVNLCRLPDEMKNISKFPVPLADIRWYLSSTDSTNILSKQPKRRFLS